jgi:hypothetical protein
MPPLVAKVPSNSDKFEAGKLTYRDLYSLRARLNFLQCAALSELRMQQWLARVSHVMEYFMPNALVPISPLIGTIFSLPFAHHTDAAEIQVVELRSGVVDSGMP